MDIPIPFPTVSSEPPAAWSASATRWAHWLIQNYPTFLAAIQRGLVRSLVRGDLPGAAFLTRRLAGELGDDDWTPQELFDLVRAHVCDSGAFRGLRSNARTLAAATEAVMTTRQPTPYEVRLTFTPALLTAPAFNALKHRYVLSVDTTHGGHRILRAVTFTLNATHASRAVADAVGLLPALVRTLRLTYYVMAQVTGTATVTSLADSSSCEIALPQPFWTRFNRLTPVPTMLQLLPRSVPGFPHITPEHWDGAVGHLSQAYAIWAEDVHRAAAEVWLALECLLDSGERGSRRATALAHAHVVRLPMQLAVMAFHRLLVQRHALVEVQAPRRVSTDWVVSARGDTTIALWLMSVLHPQSPICMERWNVPQAPLFLIHREVGLLRQLGQWISQGGVQPWMEMRLTADLDLLYALRNSIVHTGRPIFTSRLASYLGRAAATLIMDVANAAVAEHRGVKASLPNEQTVG